MLSKIPKTGMPVINDVGDATNIHPKDKRTPGEVAAKVRAHLVLKSANGIFAVREGSWKLIEQSQTASGQKREPENNNQLYDLSSDPSETQNRWEEQPEIVSRLERLLESTRGQSGASRVLPSHSRISCYQGHVFSSVFPLARSHLGEKRSSGNFIAD